MRSRRPTSRVLPRCRRRGRLVVARVGRDWLADGPPAPTSAPPKRPGARPPSLTFWPGTGAGSASYLELKCPAPFPNAQAAFAHRPPPRDSVTGYLAGSPLLRAYLTYLQGLVQTPSRGAATRQRPGPPRLPRVPQAADKRACMTSLLGPACSIPVTFSWPRAAGVHAFSSACNHTV